MRFFDLAEGHEDEYLSWYHGQHLADIVAVEGWTSGQLGRAVVRRPDPSGRTLPTYVNMVELETDDVDATLDAMVEARRGKGSEIPPFSRDPLVAVYEPITNRFEKLSDARIDWRGR
jgi:hypothetical protein